MAKAKPERSKTPAVRASAASFFQQKESGKCSTCAVQRGGLANFKQATHIVKKAGTGDDVLLVLEMPEPRNYLAEMEHQLGSAGIVNYTVALGLQCQTKGFETPSPIYSTFKSCNTIQDLPTNPRVIITVGRAINAVTKSDDIISWREFVEAQFNPSFFYTSHWWETKTRVYPIPALFDWVGKDNFEKVYVKQQLFRIKNFLQEENYTTLRYQKAQLHLVEDPNAFLREHTDRACEVVLDLETSSLHHFADDFRVGCLTIAFDDVHGYYLRWPDIDPQVLDEFLKNKTQIYANGKFDTKGMFVASGIKNAVVHHDIVLLFHCLSTERMTNGLKTLAWLVGDGGYDQPLEDYKQKYAPKSYLDIPEEILFPYATMDAVVTMRVFKLGKSLARRQLGVWKVYQDIYLPADKIAEQMEIDGMEIDIPKLVALHKQLIRDAILVEREIKAELGQPNLVLTSTAQLGRVFESLGYPCLGRNEDKSYATGAEELQRWAKMGYTVCDKILRFRSLTKLDASFVGEMEEDDPSKSRSEKFFERSSSRVGKRKKKKRRNGIVQHIRGDGKVHASFGIARTASGRASCRDPNLQNQTKHSEEAKQFRSIFKCPEDSYIYEVDMDTFQLRIVCLMSGDPVMEDIFLNRGGDMHSITGQGVFARDMPLEEFFRRLKAEDPQVVKWRQDSKAINFGLAYGRGAFSFKSDLELSWSLEAAQAYIEASSLEMILDRQSGKPDPYLTVATELRLQFFRTYPRLEKWIEECREEGRRQGYTDSILGGRRHTPWLRYAGNDVDSARWSNYLNICSNSRVQSHEAAIIYQAMVKIDKAIKRERMKSKLLFSVHDSLGGYVKKDEAKEFYHLLKENTEILSDYKIPFTSEVKFGTVWGFGKKVSEKNLADWRTGGPLIA